MIDFVFVSWRVLTVGLRCQDHQGSRLISLDRTDDSLLRLVRISCRGRDLGGLGSGHDFTSGCDTGAVAPLALLWIV